MKDSGSREPLHFLLFSISLLSKPNEDPAAPQNAAGSPISYMVFCLSISRLCIFDFHNHFQTIGKFSGFQFVPINNSNSKLRSTVPGCGIATSG